MGELEERPVDPAAQNAPQGQECNAGAHTEQDGGNPRVEPSRCPEPLPEDDAGDEIDGQNGRGEQAVQQATPDDDVDVQELEADHGHDEGYRDGQFDDSVHVGRQQWWQSDQGWNRPQQDVRRGSDGEPPKQPAHLIAVPRQFQPPRPHREDRDTHHREQPP